MFSESKSNEYQTITVNKWRLVFRFRDENRLKIGGLRDKYGEDCHHLLQEIKRFDEDDCNGDEFLTLLELLRDHKSQEDLERSTLFRLFCIKD